MPFHWLEFYNGKGDCVDQVEVLDPFQALERVAQYARQRENCFDFVIVSCWTDEPNPQEVWELEIK